MANPTPKTMPTQAELKALFDYDPETGVLIWRYVKFRGDRCGVEAGYIDLPKGYRKVRFKLKRYYAHRIIWCWMYGEIPDGTEIDHINGVKADNRLSNLRAATSEQNKWNRTATRTSRTGIKGVTFHKPSSLYSVDIKKNGKRHHIGYFKTAEEAHEAYKEAAANLHGEFAKW